MAHIERIRRYPVKGFDAEEVETVQVTDAGTVAGDREYAMTDPEATAEDGTLREFAYNGKQTARIHELRTSVDLDTETLTFRTPDGEHRRFDLAIDREAVGEWLSSYLDVEVAFHRNEPPAFVDRPTMGPSVISTATLREVASWFDELTVESARRRLRANVEVGGVPAFWEDRFVGADAPAFVAGDVRFEGAEPCARCVVPGRDPDTGDPLPEFRQRFVEKREETFPEWADPDAFDHHYTLMLISRIPEADRGKTLSVGDDVEII
ncbi:MOSC domain-containing protein [Haloplanus sp. GCM10025708]|uniref:MOSC domain-containing protein n=1 Tax=Haloferacaceae TaxID=1644056 RepID=UPI0036142A6E